jgi:transcriptional regulator with XRE-family HTH domain
MQLERYLKRKRIPLEDFAALVDVHPSTIYRFIQGLAFPKSSNLKKIAQVTNGSVSANDFLDVKRPPPSKTKRGRPRKIAQPQKERVRNRKIAQPQKENA